jgi:uncharacterized membrane-anchored protein
MMRAAAAVIDRIPRPALFAAAGLIQVALIALMVVDRIGILREGREVALQARPVDPRDFLRGDYVELAYDISSVGAGALQGHEPPGRNAPVFVKLAPVADGVFEAVSVHLEPVPLGDREVLIQGRVTSGTHCGSNRRAFCDKLRVRYGIERYFVPEGEGLEIERARDKRRVTIVAAVAPSGRAAIKRLQIDGKPVYQEPLF